MIQQLLSLFNGYKSSEYILSKTGEEINYTQNIKQFCTGFYAMQIVIIWWFIYKTNIYYFLSQRPKSLFEPMHYFAKIFMPSPPLPFMYYSIVGVGVILTLYILRLKKTPHMIIRVIQLFIVMWINLFQWSFGFASDTSDLVILVCLCSLFIPIRSEINFKEKEMQNRMIHYYFAGIFITYTISGLWKVFGIAYKLSFKPTEVSWLSPNAALYNAVVTNRNYDFAIEPILKFYQFPLFWQICFILVLFIQLFCWLGACRLPLRMWVGLSLFIFHEVNNFFFNIDFPPACVVLLVICFPYHLFNKSKLNYNTSITLSTNGDFVYTKTYLNGDVDWYKGFTAFREIMYDRHPVWGGLWFVPGAWVFYKILPLQKLITPNHTPIIIKGDQ